MANYPHIFGITFVINVLLTFRSSALWKRCFEGRTKKDTAAEGGEGEDDNKNNNNQAEQKKEERHRLLLRKYLIVYLLATLSDWLQGPYVYALYDAYGFSQHDIAVLFVAGFGSSMIFGSFVGGMADWGGRRRFVVLFSIIYAASCLTKHFNDYWILMVGRLLGGIATSLLFSVFEAWLIRSHSDAQLGRTYLSNSFSWAAYCNSIVAIFTGLMANRAASLTDMVPLTTTTTVAAAATAASPWTIHVGGYLNPFDMALIALVLCGFAAGSLWEENYGTDEQGDDDDDAGGDGGSGVDPSRSSATSSSANKGGGSAVVVGGGGGGNNDGDDDHHRGRTTNWYGGLQSALTATLRSRDILLCGLISSLFEGSMYIFVFMWTPTLKGLTSTTTASNDNKNENDDDGLPFGLIFSTFMVCCMAGSSFFSWMIQSYKGETLGVFLFGVSSLSMAIVSTSSSDVVAFAGMLIFEGAVGCYWPIMGTMKGAIVPEDKRAAIYNLYRIPLNFIVLLSLLTDLTPKQSFGLNSGMLGIATILQFVLMKRRLHPSLLMTATDMTEEEKSSLISTTTTKTTATASSAQNDDGAGGGGGGNKGTTNEMV